MQTITTQIAHATLSRLDAKRLLMAKAHLDDHNARVEIDSISEAGIDATVYHNDKIYNVFMDKRTASCTCPDYTYRGLTCKHSGIAALYLLDETNVEIKRVPAPLAVGVTVSQLDNSTSTGVIRELRNGCALVNWDHGHTLLHDEHMLQAA